MSTLYCIFLALGEIAARRGAVFADEGAVPQQGAATLEDMMRRVEHLSSKMETLTVSPRPRTTVSELVLCRGR